MRISSKRRLLLAVSPLLVTIVVMLALGGAGMYFLTGARAYVTGESLWSKAQKKAVRHLDLYAERGDPAEYQRYRDALRVNLGDRSARIELEKPEPDAAVAARGLLEGRNDPNDIGPMIELFRLFRHNTYIERALDNWAKADATIERIDGVARELASEVAAHGAGTARSMELMQEVLSLDDALTELEDQFSFTIGAANRRLAMVIGLTAILAAATLLLLGALMSRRVLSRLGESQAELQLVMDHVPALIASIDRDWRYIIVNSSYGAMYGRTPDDIAGRKLHEVIGAQTFEEVRPAFERAYAGEVMRYERTVLRGTGDTAYLEVTLVPRPQQEAGRHEIVAMLRDITEQKRAESELRAAYDRIELALEAANLCLWEWDARRGDIYLDQGWSRMLGGELREVHLPVEEMHTLVHPEDEPRVRDALREFVKGLVPEYRQEHRVRDADGRWRWIQSRGKVTERDADGSALHSVGVSIDVTERHEADERVRLLNETLEQRVAERTAELQTAMKDLEAFSYSVSHDLRAPLRHIAGFLGLLRSNVGASLDADNSRYLDAAQRAAVRLSKLIDDLLAFATLGRAELKKRPLQLGPVVDEVMRSFVPDTEGRVVEWKVGPLPEVAADPVLMRQVFANLLGNAVKYTRPRPRAAIEVGVVPEHSPHGEWSFFVRDNGVGFEMEYADKLFRVFQRLHSSQEFEGTGIGLANVGRIIERHGGRVWAEGKAGEGATIYFTLPA
jgi:PAS domain S-box-containing protein